MKIKDENLKGKDMGLLLKYDSKNNVMADYLDSRRLNFSLNSLQLVDTYLEKVRKYRKKLTEKEIKIIILRCGTYLGEVIRKKKKNVIWISYEEASQLLKDFTNVYQCDITSTLVLYDKQTESFWLPLGKVYKFLEYGKADNLSSFAKVMIHGYG